LARRIPVVPVLTDGTPLPEAGLLPDDLTALVNRQAHFMEYRTFNTDVERLIRKLGLAGWVAKKTIPFAFLASVLSMLTVQTIVMSIMNLNFSLW
jgi:hypothetical protein